MISFAREKSTNSDVDFKDVTEIAGDSVTREQVERMNHRYCWAGTYCSGKDVLEVACGNGQGLGYLKALANSIYGGDIDPGLVKKAKTHYGDQVGVEIMDAQHLPFENNTLDVVILFEAIYYLPAPAKFLMECRRVLREGGVILIAMANKDLSDFNPSPYSHVYFGVTELTELMKQHGFDPNCFGYWPAHHGGMVSKALKLAKRFAVFFGLIPKTMAGKKFLKRLVFGKLVPMPAEVSTDGFSYTDPTPISLDKPDIKHSVIYCAASLDKGIKNT